jgi:hypothetical protein
MSNQLGLAGRASRPQVQADVTIGALKILQRPLRSSRPDPICRRETYPIAGASKNAFFVEAAIRPSYLDSFIDAIATIAIACFVLSRYM